MRFLVDNALPPHLAELFVIAGHDVVHVRAYGMRAARDEEILARALEEDRIIVSADSDFGTLLALRRAAKPSFILFREAGLLIAEHYMSVLLPVLATLEPELEAGCVAVFRGGRLRVRRLPMPAE